MNGTGNNMLNMLVGHFIGEIPQKYNKPIAFVMCGDGLWEIRKNSIGTFRRRMTDVKIPGLPCGLFEGFDLSVPKIPLSILWQAVAFFREVFSLHGSEAAVRVIYDRRRKKYFLNCPQQEVCAAHCHFDRSQTFEDSVVVMEIHSHGMFSAVFSSTDDKDEIADRFYGIVGKIEQLFPETCFRLSMGGEHISVGIHELFDTKDDPMLGAKFPKDWMDKVIKSDPKAKLHEILLEREMNKEEEYEDDDDEQYLWNKAWK